jgi:hypothetical protein
MPGVVIKDITVNTWNYGSSLFNANTSGIKKSGNNSEIEAPNRSFAI